MNLFTAERNNYRRRLIMLVKKHPILWNKTQEDYKRNRPQKWQTWQDIANQMGTSADKIRRTWENLRDQYRRDLKREVKYGYISKWRFFNDMDFIRDMVTCKGSQNEFTDSDSELESTELSHILQEALDPNTNFADPRPVVGVESNHTVTTPNITDFHPIILSTQWQRASENEASTLPSSLSATGKIQNVTPNPGSEECLPTCDCSKNDQPRNQDIPPIPPTKTFAQHCDSSHNLNQEPTNIPVTFAIPTKTEPESDSDIEIEPIRAVPNPTVFPINTIIPLQPPNTTENFQESHVSTSSHKRPGELPEEPLELRASTPAKKRKSCDSDLDSKDEDFYFVMSLLPSLRQIPRNKKFALRIDLMNLIAKNLEEVCK